MDCWIEGAARYDIIEDVRYKRGCGVLQVPSITGSDMQVPARRPKPRIRDAMLAGLCVGLIGSFGLALIETSAASYVVTQRLELGDWPTSLMAAALGRAALTHVLLWCPLIVLTAVTVVALRRRSTQTPESFLWGFFVLIAGLVAAPADLAAADKSGRLLLIGACAGVVLSAVVTYVVVRSIRRRLGQIRFRRLSGLAACICAALTAGFGLALVDSPLYHADRYRVKPPRVVSTPPKRPNILWIVMDTVRADRMSCYGYDRPTTPFLEEWARKSIVFDRAVADGIWTVPSHASMFTGLCVRRHGAHNGHLWLDDDPVTIAEALTAKGYTTAAFVSNTLISKQTNLVQGFATCCRVRRLSHVAKFSLQEACERLGVTPPFSWLDGDFSAALTNQLAARWLDALPDDGTPFLLFINYMEAHLPYQVPRRYRKMFMTEQQVHRSYDLRFSVFGNMVFALGLRFDTEGGEFVSPADREVAKLQYLAAIRYLDDRVKEMVEIVERRGSLDDTLVIITSDHGEYLEAHGMWAHRFLTYNEVTNVCMLIREPGRRSGLRIPTPVQLSDLYATALGQAVYNPTPVPDSRSQDLVLLAEASPPRRVAITECFGVPPGTSEGILGRYDAELDRRTWPQVSATDGRFKYIVTRDRQRELYDLLRDPGEARNVIDVFPREAERLAEHLEEWKRSVPTYQPSGTDPGEHLSEEVRDSLRALGYIDGE